MPLKIAAKIDRVDQEYFKTTIEPLLGLGDVEFIGEIREDQKSEFLGNAAALLFPIAWREPFGLVMIESMACGTPVIAFENGSVPEVLEDGVTGFIVRDELEAVEAVGRAVALDRDRIRAEFERRFTARRMAQNYVSVYSRLAKAFRRARAGNETAKQDKFQAQSLVPSEDAPIAAKRDLAAVAVAPRDAGMGVLQ
jgi:glycosyltransferase involved in cell wall biosynthesis